MSLIGDVVDLAARWRSARAQTNPPVSYTANTAGRFSILGGGTEPTRRHLDLSTGESTLFSILDLISQDVADVEWGLYRTGRTRQPVEQQAPLTVDQHLAVQLWEQPNDFMTGAHLRRVVQWHYDAVGEGWIVVAYNAARIPESFWWVRPDRMLPRPDPERFLVGYTYLGPNGERVPLELDEVLRITRPHPIDPYRGIGAVGSLVTPVVTAMTQQQWVKAFYENGAIPGGMIELGLDDLMDPDDFRKYVARWNDQHQGVNRAHKVGVLEMGHFNPATISFKDLQVTEMRQLSRDQIMEAFRIHPHMMGIAENVNKAVAFAADTTYGKRTLAPRVKTWADMANGPFLATFGATGKGVTWVPESVVPEDVELDNATRDSKVNAACALMDHGVDPVEAFMAVGLPPMRMVDAAPDPDVVTATARRLKRIGA